MKTKRLHVVPLSDPAIELVQGVGVLRGQDRLVFPGTQGQPVTDNTLSRLMRDAARWLAVAVRHERCRSANSRFAHLAYLIDFRE